MNTDNLRDKSRKGLVWDLTGALLKQLSSLVISIVLARLLSPEYFGIIGIALVFIAVSQVFIDVGFTDGLIQRKDVSDTVYSSVFYINFIISLVMAMIIYFAAPFVGNFYNSEEITHVIQYLTIVLPIAAIGKVHATQLVKRLAFKSLAIRDIGSIIIGGSVGIIAALNNQGIYSLVWQQVATVFVSSILLWLGTRWKPLLVFSWSEIKNVLIFSSYVFFDQAFRQIFQRLDTLFIGKVFSPLTLGFYSRAEALNAQVTTYTASSLQKVIFPVFSIVQEDEDRFRAIYFKAFSLAAVISSTLAGVLFFLSDKIIIGLLGEKWAPSIIIFQILLFRTVTAPFGALMGKCLLSKGYSKVKFKMSFFQRLIMLLPMVVGFFYGIEVFALVVVAASIVAFLLNAFILDRYLQLNFLLQVQRFLFPLIPLIFMGVAYHYLFPDVNSFVIVFIYIVLQWIFLIVTRNVGYKLAYQEFTQIIRRIFQ